MQTQIVRYNEIIYMLLSVQKVKIDISMNYLYHKIKMRPREIFDLIVVWGRWPSRYRATEKTLPHISI